jgi:hypothetical protein
MGKEVEQRARKSPWVDTKINWEEREEKQDAKRDH